MFFSKFVLLVITDGNNKNHRARCPASFVLANSNEATDHNALCCPETPLQKSYFCYKHSNYNNNSTTYDSNFFSYQSLHFCNLILSPFLSLVDFIDIVGHDIDKLTKLVTYKFKYESYPYIRHVEEKNAPLGVISEYLKRNNLLDKSLVGPVTDSCYINKALPCYNKTKTKGYLVIFSFILFIDIVFFIYKEFYLYLMAVASLYDSMK